MGQSEGHGLSASATALMLITWQTPTDRALAGWTPYPGVRPADFDEDGLIKWLEGRMWITTGETGDLLRLRA